MPDRITFHWSAGRYLANSVDKSDYHFLVEYDPQGAVAMVRKQHPTDAVLAHTLGRNTGNVAVSLCAMFNASPANFGAEPITRLQVEAACFVASQIALIKGIGNSRIRTHAEYAIMDGYFGDRWDVILEPSDKTFAQLVPVAKADGKRLRRRVEQYSLQYSDQDLALRTIGAMGRIYEVRDNGIRFRQSDGSFADLGPIIEPTLRN